MLKIHYTNTIKKDRKNYQFRTLENPVIQDD